MRMCDWCNTSILTENEMVNHVRIKHPGILADICQMQIMGLNEREIEDVTTSEQYLTGNCPGFRYTDIETHNSEGEIYLTKLEEKAYNNAII